METGLGANIYSRLRNAARLSRMSNGAIDAVKYQFSRRSGAGAVEKVFDFKHEGLRFSARVCDWSAVEEVLLDFEYGFIGQLFETAASPVIVDLGANIGMFSLYALSLWPKATVLSVESSTATFELLKRNHDRNPGMAWKAHHAAVWKENGTISFKNTGSSTGGHICCSGSADETVPAATLGSLLESNGVGKIDLLKMDIEGAEEAVLAECAPLLERVGAIIIEVHPTSCDARRVLDILKKEFIFIYGIPGRKSSKPLLLASRRTLPLPEYAPTE